MTEQRVDPMAVTWTEKYSKTLDRFWNKLPNFLGSFIATVAVFLLGATIRGIYTILCNVFVRLYKSKQERRWFIPIDFHPVHLTQRNTHCFKMH